MVTATLTDHAGNTSAFSVPMRIARQILYQRQPVDSPTGLLPPVEAAVADGAGVAISNALTDLSVMLLASPSGDTLGGTLAQHTAAGVATFADLQLSQPAVGYQLRVSAPRLTQADSALFTISVGAASAGVGGSLVHVPAGMAGEMTIVSVTVRDAFGNVRTAGGDSVAASISGANAGLPVTLVDNHDGTYNLTYTPTVTGTDQMAITVGGQAIAGSPFSSLVSPAAADPAHCSAVVPAGTAGAPTVCTVTVRDANDNVRTAGGDSVAATIAGANAGSPVTVTDNADGTYSLSYTPTVSGTDQVAITVDGQAIAGSPFSSLVGPAAVDAEHSTLTAAPLAAAAGEQAI
ncbi:MAG: hypothetical protein HUU35_10375, partial [Armatimonadetes bacterium]|nr:hypothetical protein [Armatimonadota bacterium]